MCAHPRWRSAFCGLLGTTTGDDASGVFGVDLRDTATTTQRYLRNTAILETMLRDVTATRCASGTSARVIAHGAGCFAQ
jgi:hypothetical protein